MVTKIYPSKRFKTRTVKVQSKQNARMKPSKLNEVMRPLVRNYATQDVFVNKMNTIVLALPNKEYDSDCDEATKKANWSWNESFLASKPKSAITTDANTKMMIEIQMEFEARTKAEQAKAFKQEQVKKDNAARFAKWQKEACEIKAAKTAEVKNSVLRLKEYERRQRELITIEMCRFDEEALVERYHRYPGWDA